MIETIPIRIESQPNLDLQPVPDTDWFINRGTRPNLYFPHAQGIHLSQISAFVGYEYSSKRVGTCLEYQGNLLGERPGSIQGVRRIQHLDLALPATEPFVLELTQGELNPKRVPANTQFREMLFVPAQEGKFDVYASPKEIPDSTEFSIKKLIASGVPFVINRGTQRGFSTIDFDLGDYTLRFHEQGSFADLEIHDVTKPVDFTFLAQFVNVPAQELSPERINQITTVNGFTIDEIANLLAKNRSLSKNAFPFADSNGSALKQAIADVAQQFDKLQQQGISRDSLIADLFVLSQVAESTKRITFGGAELELSENSSLGSHYNEFGDMNPLGSFVLIIRRAEFPQDVLTIPNLSIVSGLPKYNFVPAGIYGNEFFTCDVASIARVLYGIKLD